MENGQIIIQLRDEKAPRESDKVRLAAALTALGAPLDTDIGLQWFRENAGGKTVEQTVITLRAMSIEEKWDPAELAKAWDDDAWHAANPGHPLAYIRAAFRNLDKILAFLCEEQGPLAVIRRGNRRAIISKRTTPEQRAKLLADLNS